MYSLSPKTSPFALQIGKGIFPIMSNEFVFTSYLTILSEQPVKFLPPKNKLLSDYQLYNIMSHGNNFKIFENELISK